MVWLALILVASLRFLFKCTRSFSCPNAVLVLLILLLSSDHNLEFAIAHDSVHHLSLIGVHAKSKSGVLCISKRQLFLMFAVTSSYYCNFVCIYCMSRITNCIDLVIAFSLRNSNSPPSHLYLIKTPSDLSLTREKSDCKQKHIDEYFCQNATLLDSHGDLKLFGDVGLRQ